MFPFQAQFLQTQLPETHNKEEVTGIHNSISGKKEAAVLTYKTHEIYVKSLSLHVHKLYLSQAVI